MQEPKSTGNPFLDMLSSGSAAADINNARPQVELQNDIARHKYLKARLQIALLLMVLTTILISCAGSYLLYRLLSGSLL